MQAGDHERVPRSSAIFMMGRRVAPCTGGIDCSKVFQAPCALRARPSRPAADPAWTALSETPITSLVALRIATSSASSRNTRVMGTFSICAVDIDTQKGQIADLGLVEIRVDKGPRHHLRKVQSAKAPPAPQQIGN